jgi:radical SAM protein with 4Fe4S-binding SPASM domain
MCPHDLMTREVGFMEFDLFKEVVDQVSGYSSVIRLHNMGESLFHKKISEFIEYGKKKKLKTVLSTNASALSEKTTKKILDAELNELLISFDGTSKETYEICRSKAKFEKVLRNINRLLELKAANGKSFPKITMSLIDMPMTHNEVEKFKNNWTPRVESVRIKAARNWDGSSDRINQLVDVPGKRKETQPCFWLWSKFVILWDGRVVPCCMDYDAKYVLGNVKEKSLQEIFNDKPIQELRRLHIEGKVFESELCRGCSAPTGAKNSKLSGATTIARMLKHLQF